MIITVGVIGPVYINIAKGSFVIAEGRSLLKATQRRDSYLKYENYWYR
jgi:hypothetical protein